MLTKKHRNWRLWLALIAFGALLSFAARLTTVIDAVEQEAFIGQWSEKVRAFDMILNEIDDYVRYDQDWGLYDYAQHLCPTIQDFDDNRGVFAGLYNEQLQLLSEREVMFNEVALEPLNDPELAAAVANSERGSRIVSYPASNLHYNWVRVYFRWVPTGKQYEDRLLAVVAMWPGAMDGHPAERLTSWCIGLLALSTLEILMIAIALVPRREAGA